MVEFNMERTSAGSTYHVDQFGNKIAADGRPSDLIDPKKKDKGWILAMAKAIYVDYNRYYPSMFFNNRVVWDENIMYLQGLIDPARYQQMADQNRAETRNLSTVNYDKRFLNVLSKYFRILKGKLADIEFSTTCTPVNALARQHMKEFESKLQVATEMNLISEQYNIPELLDVLAKAGFDDLPTDDIEKQIFLQNSLPYKASMNMELYLKWVNYVGKLKQKMQEADYDLIACGVAAFREDFDANGNPFSERVDPRSLLVGWSNTEDFRDISEVGEFRMITLNEIMKEDVNGDLEGQYETIEQFYVGRYGNQQWYPDNQVRGFRNMDPVYAKNRVLVIDIYFYSYDEDTFVAADNKFGNRRVAQKEFGYYNGKKRGDGSFAGTEKDFKRKYPDRELYRTRVKNIYKTTWLVGTDYIYNYGLFRNMARTKSDPVDTVLPIIITAPLMRNGKAVSLIEELKPIADGANLAWQKMQDAIAHSRPPGFEFDVDSLYAAIKGMAGDGYNFQKVLENMLVHNIIPVSRKELNGVSNGAKPFEERYGGMGPDFNQWKDTLVFYMNMLEQITGLSNVAAGNDVQYTGKEVANLAMSTADYSIRHLFEGKKDLFQSMMELKAMIGMDAIAEGKGLGLKQGLGGAYEFFEINKNTSLYEYGIQVEFKNTAAEWQEFNQMVQVALSMPPEQGGITLIDAGRIKECETIKQANAYLYVAIKKNQREAQARQSQMLQEKAQTDQQTAQLTQQAQAAQIQMTEASQIRVMQATQNEQRITEEQKYKYALQLEQLKGLIKTDQLNKQGQIDSHVTQQKVQGNMDRIKTNTTQVGS